MEVYRFRFVALSSADSLRKTSNILKCRFQFEVELGQRSSDRGSHPRRAGRSRASHRIRHSGSRAQCQVRAPHPQVAASVLPLDVCCKLRKLFFFWGKIVTRDFSDREKGIQGKEVTPYVLEKVNALTSGKSLEASIL